MIHYIVTNRPILKDPVSGVESIDTSDAAMPASNIRFATYDLDTGEITLIPDLIKPAADVPVSYNPKSVAAAQEGSAKFFTSLYSDMSQSGKDALVFVHGFDNDFAGGISNIKELHDHYITPGSNIGHIILYSWPSKGQVLEYRSDRRNAEVSGYSLARGYLKLKQFFEEFFKKDDDNKRVNQPCGNNIHLMCHSMGNQVLYSMFEMLESEDFPITTLFKEVILTGEDVDNDALQLPKALYRVTEICERAHSYYNTKDAALTISETTKNSLNRLGKYGPANIGGIPLHVNIVDASYTKPAEGVFEDPKDNLVNHWYHYNNPAVVKDMQAVLSGEPTEDIKTRTFLQHNNVFRIDS